LKDQAEVAPFFRNLVGKHSTDRSEPIFLYYSRFRHYSYFTNIIYM